MQWIIKIDSDDLLDSEAQVFDQYMAGKISFSEFLQNAEWTKSEFDHEITRMFKAAIAGKLGFSVSPVLTQKENSNSSSRPGTELIKIGSTVEISANLLDRPEFDGLFGLRFKVVDIKSDRSACLLDLGSKTFWVVTEALVDMTHYGA